MFDSQETNRLRDLVNGGAVLDKSTVLDMLTELEARGNKVVNLEKSIERVREVCESDKVHFSNEYGDYSLIHVYDIEEALDGEA